MGAAEVTGGPFLVGLALLMPDDHHLHVVEFGEAGADRPVVAEEFVAVQLDELVEEQFEVVGRHRAFRMPGHLDGFPGLEPTIGLLDQLHPFAAEPAQLVADFRIVVGGVFEFLDPRLQFVNRPFEREPVLTCSHILLALEYR